LGEAKEKSTVLHVGPAAANTGVTMRTKTIAAAFFILAPSSMRSTDSPPHAAIIVGPGLEKVVKEL
jgi:hypothetical protein